MELYLHSPPPPQRMHVTWRPLLSLLEVWTFISSICKGTGKVVSVNAMKAYRWSRGIAPLNLNSGTRWRCVANFFSRPVYAKNRTVLNRRLGCSSGRSGRFGQEKISFSCWDSNPEPTVRSLLTIPTMPSWLSSQNWRWPSIATETCSL
jgi:hypothetical protein